jgi:hypothetical protein
MPMLESGWMALRRYHFSGTTKKKNQKEKE